MRGAYVFHGSTGENQSTSSPQISCCERTTWQFLPIEPRTQCCNLWMGPAEKTILGCPVLSVPLNIRFSFHNACDTGRSPQTPFFFHLLYISHIFRHLFHSRVRFIGTLADARLVLWWRLVITPRTIFDLSGGLQNMYYRHVNFLLDQTIDSL
jgi:hypothetical protein